MDGAYGDLMRQRRRTMSGEKHPESFKPVGTVTVLLIYLFFVVLLWGAAYLTVIERGVTR